MGRTTRFWSRGAFTGFRDRPYGRLGNFWREHGVPMVLYALLTVALTWPTLRDFSTRLISVGGDARNNLWMIWHVKEVVLGNHHLFEMPLLYFPAGVNLLARGLGPVVGVLALPFWPLGLEAAHNGSLLLGFWMTGYFMYLLGRGLSFERRVAFFAGVMLLVAPIHLGGVLGHMTKTFLGLLPLALLALHHTLDRRRSPWWALVLAVVLFLLLFHNLYQFVFAALALAFFTIARLFVSPGAQAPEDSPPGETWLGRERRAILWRAALAAIVALALVGPFTVLFIGIAQDTVISVDANLQSLTFQPDLAELFLPPTFSLFWGGQTAQFLRQFGVTQIIETNVFLSWTALVLSALALFKGSRRARPWLLFALLCVLLSLGPSLQWLGERTFTEYELTVLMPYALLTGLPGFDFMRAPGRFMMIGSVGFGVSAAFGLAWLLQRYPRRATMIALAVTMLALVEIWPRPWPQEMLHPVPDFYQQIAADDERYGVFDLPVKPTEEAWFVGYSAYYQRYQMVHRKGLASGYLARTYATHPTFPCVIPEFQEPQADVLVDGMPADCAANLLHDLAFYHYRYVVHHKPDLSDKFDAWGRAQARRFIDVTFDGQAPIVDDDLVTVYAVPALSEVVGDLGLTMGLLENWYWAEGNEDASWRWAQSPATLFLSVPHAQSATLELTPGVMFEPDPEADQVMGHRGKLRIELDGDHVQTLWVSTDEMVAIPLDLRAGIHTLTLALEAGNFRPLDYEGMGKDRRRLSFTIRSMNLVTDR